MAPAQPLHSLRAIRPGVRGRARGTYWLVMGFPGLGLLLLGAAPGPPAEQLGKPVDWDSALVSVAEASGANAVLCHDRVRVDSATEHPLWSALVPDNPCDLAKAFRMEFTEQGGVAWIATKSRWDRPLASQYAETARARTIRLTLKDVTQHLGRALLGTITPEQWELLSRPWQPEHIVGVYDVLTQVRQRHPEWPADFLKMGGLLMGDKMTDYQRRMCAATGFSYWLPHITWEELQNFEETALLDSLVGGTPQPVWKVEIFGRNYRDAPFTESLRLRGPLVFHDTIDVALPAHVYQGEELEALVRTARDNARPPSEDILPQPPCAHLTDGPTGDLTTLLDQEEANLTVFIPQDIAVPSGPFLSAEDLPRVEDVLATFHAAGYQFRLPPEVAKAQGTTQDRTRTDGGMDFLTVLHSVLEGHPERLWKREGKTFTLVYDWELGDRYALDPTKWLAPDAAAKAVTVTAKRITVKEFLATLREQSGAPLYPSPPAQETPVRLTVRLKEAPLSSVLAGLAPSFEGAWERTSEGNLLLVPRDYLAEYATGTFTTEEVQDRLAKVCGMSLSLLMERLTPEQIAKARGDGLRRAELDDVGQELIQAIAQSAFALPELEGERVTLRQAAKGEDGLWRGRILIGDTEREVLEVRPPTIPPNPLSAQSLYSYRAVDRT